MQRSALSAVVQSGAPARHRARFSVAAQHHREDLASQHSRRTVLTGSCSPFEKQDSALVGSGEQRVEIDEDDHFAQPRGRGASGGEHQLGEGVGHGLLFGERGVGREQLQRPLAHPRTNALARDGIPLAEQRDHAVLGAQTELGGAVGPLLSGAGLAIIAP
ncbi:MAG: hypothetical protein R2715_08150 [Ilumatobacteraceae bacterium]